MNFELEIEFDVGVEEPPLDEVLILEISDSDSESSNDSNDYSTSRFKDVITEEEKQHHDWIDSMSKSEYQNFMEAQQILSVQQSSCFPSTSKLFLGGINCIASLCLPEQYGFTRVLCCAGGKKDVIEQSRYVQGNPHRVTCKFLDLEDADSQDIKSSFVEAHAFIEEALHTGNVVLVHCVSGKSRSATIIISYLMQKYKLNLEAALKQVQTLRLVVLPNEGFMKQLQQYEEELKRI